MFVRQDHGWVEEEWETIDPDVLDDSLKILTHWEQDISDVMWRLIYQMDPFALREMREMQKMALARYGKQSLLQWDDVNVMEIDHAFDRLKKLFANEGAVEGAGEDD